MSIFVRHDDVDERALLLKQAQERQAEVKAGAGRLNFLTESLRQQNETNHFVERIRLAYGKAEADGRTA